MNKYHYSLALFFALAFLSSGCLKEKIQKCCENPIVEGNLDSSRIVMPTAFTPDGDGNNDVFRPVQAVNVIYSEFKVFNRFGQKIYDGADNNNAGWDGKHNDNEVPQGVYNYDITYLSSLGNSGSLSGKCSLIRTHPEGCSGLDLSSCQFEDGIILGGGWNDAYVSVSDNEACQ